MLDSCPITFDAVLLCAGAGSRFTDTFAATEASARFPIESKILVKLHGKPALAYLLQTIDNSPYINNSVLVEPVLVEPVLGETACDSAIATLLETHLTERSKNTSSGTFTITQGGEQRQHSLKNGLLALQKLGDKASTWCLVFDAARPLVSLALIERIAHCIACTRAVGDTSGGRAFGVIPIVPINDSIKRIEQVQPGQAELGQAQPGQAKLGQEGIVVETLERAPLRAAQTPQAFPRKQLLEWLLAAEQKTPRQSFVDEAQLAMANGSAVKYIQGEARAHKLTTQQDIPILEGLIATMQTRMEYRTCSGYDQHAVCRGDILRLCGLSLPCDFALKGHSDADVVLHALCDAILALAGSGDIGEHFPPTEDRWRNADSAIFLKHALELLAKADGKLVNADVTILAEKPNLRQHKVAMRARLSELTKLEGSRIGLKATTLEGLGALGRGEGIAAIASATAKFPTA